MGQGVPKFEMEEGGNVRGGKGPVIWGKGAQWVLGGKKEKGPRRARKQMEKGGWRQEGKSTKYVSVRKTEGMGGDVKEGVDVNKCGKK